MYHIMIHFFLVMTWTISRKGNGLDTVVHYNIIIYTHIWWRAHCRLQWPKCVPFVIVQVFITIYYVCSTIIEIWHWIKCAETIQLSENKHNVQCQHYQKEILLENAFHQYLIVNATDLSKLYAVKTPLERFYSYYKMLLKYYVILSWPKIIVRWFINRLYFFPSFPLFFI